MPTYKTITESTVKRARTAFNKLTAKERKAFYLSIPLEIFANVLGGRSFLGGRSYGTPSSFRSNYALYRKKLNWGYFQRLRGEGTDYRRARTETTLSHKLRVRILAMTAEEFLEMLETVVKSFPAAIFIRSMGFPSCCGAKTWQLEGDKDSTGSKITKKTLLVELSEAKYNKNTSASASNWFLILPEKLITKQNSELKALGWTFIISINGQSHYFKACLLKSHSDRLEREKKVYVERYTTKTKRNSAYSHPRSCSMASDVGAYTGFGDGSISVDKNSFQSTKYPIDYLILRNMGTTVNKQIYHNFKACLAQGFKPLYEGYTPFQNSAHQTSDNWLYVMYRVNPHYEEDR